MAKHNKNGTEGRKAWQAPELRRLNAGAAEAQTSGTLGDGGGPGASRS